MTTISWSTDVICHSGHWHNWYNWIS